MSELTIVAASLSVAWMRFRAQDQTLPMVIKPPPPMPVRARMKLRKTIFGAIPQPRHPIKKVVVDIKKQMRRPRMSEKRP